MALLSFLVFIFPLELFSLHFRFQEALQSIFLLFFFRISGEAILGTQRYFKRSFKKNCKEALQETLKEDLPEALK